MSNKKLPVVLFSFFLYIILGCLDIYFWIFANIKFKFFWIGSRKNFDDSDDDCTPSNSYHNSSESNSSSASYNSLHNVNTESATAKQHHQQQQQSTKVQLDKSTKEASYDSFRDEASHSTHSVQLEHRTTMSTNSNLNGAHDSNSGGLYEQTNSSRIGKLDDSHNHDEYKAVAQNNNNNREKINDSNCEVIPHSECDLCVLTLKTYEFTLRIPITFYFIFFFCQIWQIE